MRRVARGLTSLALFALFGAGALVLSLLCIALAKPERCHFAVRGSWRALLWLFEATRLVKIDRGGLPRCRGCVIAANHPSLIDVVILVALVPKTLFVAKSALRRNFFMSLIVRAAALPDDASLPAAAAERLRKGWNILVFPEGTRSPAGGVLPFRRGAAQTAARCGAPVEVVAVRQSRRILGKRQMPWEMGERRVAYSFASEGPVSCAPEEGESLHAAAVRATADIERRCARLLASLAPEGKPAAFSAGTLRDVAAAVPVYNPEPAFAGICKELSEKFGAVVVVDDGSVANVERFASLPQGTVLLRHGKNLGKGAALKTALAWLEDGSPQRFAGAVFVDGDGQHTARDAARVADAMLESGRFAIGARDLGASGVPRRSRTGNAWIRFFLWLFSGAEVEDSQSGLRAAPARLFPLLRSVGGARYEYETCVLAALASAGETVEEPRIETIYAPGNPSSHHRPFRDSARVWLALVAQAFRRK